MKKRLLSTALLCVLSIGVLAGCDNEEVEDVTGGDDVEYSISITNKSELQESWSVGDSSRSLSVALSPEGNPTQEVTTGALTVTSSDSTVVAATGLNLSAQGVGSATITVNWHDATDSVALTVSEASYESIGTINAGIAAGTIEDGDTVRFYGRFVGGMEPSTTHLYSGVYLADGEDSLMLYAGNITQVFFEDGEQVINFGDDLAVTATVSAYSGFYEFRPTDVVVLTEAQSLEYGITDPEIITITEDNLESFTCYDVGQLAQATVTYESHSADSSGHVTISATLGETPFTVYVNYHNGTEQMAIINEALLGMSAGTELTVCGVIGWHNGLQICPNFIYVDGEVVTPSEGFIVGEQTAPTTITIVAADGVTSPASLKAGETLQLSISVGRGENASVTWTSSDEDVASVSASGLVTAGEKEGTATITATSTVAEGVTDTFDVSVVSSSGPVIAEELDDGGTYKLGYRDEHYVKHFVSDAGEVVSSYEEGAAVLYEVVEGGVTLKIGEKYVTNSSNSLALEDTAEVLTCTEDGAFKSSEELILGTDASGVLGFYSDPVDTLVLWDYAIDNLLTEAPVTGQYYVSFTDNTGVIHYFDWTKSGYYIGTTTDFSKAVLVDITVSDDGITFGHDGTYLSYYVSNGYVDFQYSADEPIYFTYNQEYNAFEFDVQDSDATNKGNYYLGAYYSDATQGNYNLSSTYIAEAYAGTNTDYIANLRTEPEYPDLIGIKLSASRTSGYEGGTITITPTYYPTCIVTEPEGLEWTSDTDGTTVEGGVVTLGSASEDPVTITASVGDISASIELTIAERTGTETLLGTLNMDLNTDSNNNPTNISSTTRDNLVSFWVGTASDFTAVSDVSYVYIGANSNSNTDAQKVLQIGSSSAAGSITLSFSEEISKVVVYGASYGANSIQMQVNGGAYQTFDKGYISSSYIGDSSSWETYGDTKTFELGEDSNDVTISTYTSLTSSAPRAMVKTIAVYYYAE